MMPHGPHHQGGLAKHSIRVEQLGFFNLSLRRAIGD